MNFKKILILITIGAVIFGLTKPDVPRTVKFMGVQYEFSDNVRLVGITLDLLSPGGRNWAMEKKYFLIANVDKFVSKVGGIDIYTARMSAANRKKFPNSFRKRGKSEMYWIDTSGRIVFLKLSKLRGGAYMTQYVLLPKTEGEIPPKAKVDQIASDVYENWHTIERQISSRPRQFKVWINQIK